MPIVLAQLVHVVVSVDPVTMNVTIVMPDVAVVGIAILTILPEVLAILLSIDRSRCRIGALRRSTCCEEADQRESYESMVDDG